MDYPVKQWMPLLLNGSESADVRHEVIQDILSHPSELPTFEEIAYNMPSTDTEEVQSQVNRLLTEEIITTVSGSDLEYKFLGLTQSGKQFIVDSGLYDGHTAMKCLHKRLEKTESIQKKFEAQRPYYEPAVEEYTENDKDTEWEEAFDDTFENVYVAYTLVDSDAGFFDVELLDTDKNILEKSELVIPDYDERLTDTYREMKFVERRHNYSPDSYSLNILPNSKSHMYTIRLLKNGDYWHKTVKRDLCIFMQQ